jgi:hypothetical protein
MSAVSGAAECGARRGEGRGFDGACSRRCSRSPARSPCARRCSPLEPTKELRVVAALPQAPFHRARRPRPRMLSVLLQRAPQLAPDEFRSRHAPLFRRTIEQRIHVRIQDDRRRALPAGECHKSEVTGRHPRVKQPPSVAEGGLRIQVVQSPKRSTRWRNGCRCRGGGPSCANALRLGFGCARDDRGMRR